MAEIDIASPEGSGNADFPQTFVYVIAAGSDAVKIGIAKDVQRRMKELQTGHYHRLSVFRQIACLSRCEAFAIENRAHKLLAANALEGEWFSVSPDVAAAAVERVISEMEVERGRKEEAARNVSKIEVEAAPVYLGPDITPAEPWMRDPMALLRFLVEQKVDRRKEYLFDFGDCVIFVGHRKEPAASEHLFFMNDVTRWHVREEDRASYDSRRKASRNNPLGNPPCALFATILQPSMAAA